MTFNLSGCTHHILDDFVFAILPLDLQQMVAEVKKVKAALLSQQHNDGAASPVQPITKALPVNIKKPTINNNKNKFKFSGSQNVGSDIDEVMR